MSDVISHDELKGYRVREDINDEPAPTPFIDVETQLSPFEARYNAIAARDGEECAQLAVDGMDTYGCGLARAAEIVSHSAEYVAARQRHYDVLREQASARRAARAAATKRAELVQRLDGARSGLRASETAIERLEADIKGSMKLRATAGVGAMKHKLEHLRAVVLVKQRAAVDRARADLAEYDAKAVAS